VVNHPQPPPQQQAQRTAKSSMMSSSTISSSSSDDWFNSPGISTGAMTATNRAAPPPRPPPAAPSSGSGFYSMPTATTSAAAGRGMGSMSHDSTYNNPYGSIGSSTGGGVGSGSYYGGGSSSSSRMYTNSIPSSSGVSSTIIPPPSSAFGMTSSNIMYEMGGPIGGTTSLEPSATAAAAGIAAPMPHVFDPRIAAAAKKIETSSDNNHNSIASYEEDYENEPPLLEELGVNFPHIYSKSRAVLFPFGKHAKSLESGFIENDADLAGPLAFALGLGGELLLSGKLHFGYVYGFGVSGCVAMTFLLNLLNPNGAVSMWTVISILGYALLPVNLLAGINMILRVHKLGLWGMVLAVLTIAWCTTASARLFERGCNMREQRFLVAYPTALLYSAFVIITIF
jgi:hypothetical protein